jgi:polyvinyl alcohol dehydrogenase (cytochrome)
MPIIKSALQWSAMALLCLSATAVLPADWRSGGHDLKNSRFQPDENKISPRTVVNLTKRWELTTSGDVTAHPAVDGDFLYFPDSAGFLYKVNRSTGAVVWKNTVTSYTGIPGDSARATPAVVGDSLILGNLAGRNVALFGQTPPQPARVF